MYWWTEKELASKVHSAMYIQCILNNISSKLKLVQFLLDFGNGYVIPRSCNYTNRPLMYEYNCNQIVDYVRVGKCLPHSPEIEHCFHDS